jgi:general secretion pathway protein I
VKSRGFTLIEVLVAVSILGLGLTIILSSQAGLYASNQRAQHVTVATNLLRCKMSEVELQLQKDGFPLLDQTEEGECCEDESDLTYSCEWAIEPIELPQPATLEENQEGAPAEGAPTDAASASGDALGAMGANFGALGAMMGVQQTQGAALGENPSMGDLAGMMSSAAPEGAQSMATMAMSLVYPSLKPMLEASIRKITVRVRWNEGSKRQELVATQYLTNPTEGSLDPSAAEGLEDVANALGIGDTGAGDTSAAGKSKPGGSSKSGGERGSK